MSLKLLQFVEFQNLKQKTFIIHLFLRFGLRFNPRIYFKS